jgi:hypothetical protein
MGRRALALLCFACLALPAGAAASNPTGVPTVTTTADRWKPVIVFAYPSPVTVQPANVSVHRVGGTTQTPFQLDVFGGTVTISVDASLPANSTYFASVLPDGDSVPDTKTWKTRVAPAHPTLHAKIITSLDPAAADDIVRRLDRSNLLAAPKLADLVDVSQATGRTLTAADLTGYQSALVVTDSTVGAPAVLANVLAGFTGKGHGVVTGGETHWSDDGPDWTVASAVTNGLSSSWDSHWSMFAISQPYVVTGGNLAPATRQTHFLTRYLTSFHVIGPSSGQCAIKDYFSGIVLARLDSSTGCPASEKRQVFLSARQINGGRVVDLGFNPWSNAVAGGGYDPAVSNGAGLVARALWWATNRIPPTGTHFTYKPPNPAHYNTIWFTAAGSDPDPPTHGNPMGYQFKVNRGAWKRATGTTLLLKNLRPGYYTVYARAVDSGGNVDPRPAHFRVRVP